MTQLYRVTGCGLAIAQKLGLALKRLGVLGFILACGSGFSAEAQDLHPEYAHAVAQAIYLAEGGEQAKVPYGIISVRVRSYWEARRVCINTVNNTWLRWQESGRRGNFIDFLSNRYCPPSADARGNRNWRRNVKYFLARFNLLAQRESDRQWWPERTQAASSG